MSHGRAGRARRPDAARARGAARGGRTRRRGARRPVPGQPAGHQPSSPGAPRGGARPGPGRGQATPVRARPAAIAGARRMAGALPRPMGAAAGRIGHRDRPRPAGTSERRADMTDIDSRRGVVTTEADGRQRVEFRRSWPDPIEDVWAALTEPDRLARWIGVYEGERRAGGTGTFAMTQEEGAAAGQPTPIVECDPPPRLGVEWPDASSQMERIDLDLGIEGGRTVLRFVQFFPATTNVVD